MKVRLVAVNTERLLVRLRFGNREDLERFVKLHLGGNEYKDLADDTETRVLRAHVNTLEAQLQKLRSGMYDDSGHCAHCHTKTVTWSSGEGYRVHCSCGRLAAP